MLTTVMLSLHCPSDAYNGTLGFRAAVPTLYHPDLHKRNIYVSKDDPTIITDVIDWQSSSIEPAFMYADETPDFTGPIHGVSSDDGPAAVNAELCRQAFGACLQALIPRVWAASMLDDDLLRPFRYCDRTWKDGAVAFRQELIDVFEPLAGPRTGRSLPVPSTHARGDAPSGERFQAV